MKVTQVQLPVGARVVKTVIGRAIHADATLRQPLVPVQGSGYNAGNVAAVPAPAIKAPFARYPHNL